MRTFMLAAAAVLVPVASFGQSPADPAKFAPVERAMQKFIDDGEISGAVTVIGRGSGVVAIQAFGVRDLETGAPMTADTLFRIASMTKPVTALAVMILAEEGKLDVADPVEKYLPEFRGQKLVVKGDDGKIELKDPARPITLRDLLTHTSGLRGEYPGEMKDVYKLRNFTLAETVSAVAKEPLQFEPGTKWAYCNPGIDTLGRVVEVLSGQPYEEFLRRRIFDPLSMADTTPFPSEEQLTRTARNYEKKNGKLVPAGPGIVGYFPGAKHPIPAGGLYSTANDLAKLYRMMLNRGELNGRRVVSEKSLAEMTKLQSGEIKTGFVDGMGWGYGVGVVRQPQGVTAALSAGSFGHGGAVGTQAWLDPHKDLFLVLLIQRTGIPNSDGSPMRKAFQDAAVAALE